MSFNKQSFQNSWRISIAQKPYQWAIGITLFLGTLFRLRQFLTVRSLWLDESMLALNILNRSYSELLAPLDYSQAAPLLFLWIEKTFTILGDTSEISLRLFPLISSITALLLYPIIARKYMSWRATLIALVFFAFSSSLIYFASEVKQYTSDVFALLVGLLLLFFILEKKLSSLQAFILMISGCLLLTMSHPSVFVLASNTVVFLFVYFRTRTKLEFFRAFAIAVGWGLFFLLLYFVSLSHIAANPILTSFWRGSYPPSPSEPMAYFSWFGRSFLNFFKNPGNLPLVTLAIPVVILGIISFIKRTKILSISLILPVILVLVASTLHKYPFNGRLLLFLTPLLYLFLGEGIDTLFRIKSRPLSIAIGITVFLFLLFNSLLQVTTDFRTPPMGEDIKPAIQYIADNWQEGDQIYIYYSSIHPFEYYQERFSFDDRSLYWGTGNRKDWTQYLAEIELIPQSNDRLWLLFSHVHFNDTMTEEAYIIENLIQAKHQKIDETHADNAAAYLMQFKNTD